MFIGLYSRNREGVETGAGGGWVYRFHPGCQCVRPSHHRQYLWFCNSHHYTRVMPLWNSLEPVWDMYYFSNFLGIAATVQQSKNYKNERLFVRKRKRSDSVLWQKPLHQQKCQKGKVTTQTTPQKSSIKQRLRTDLGRSVGVTTATQLVWLTGLRAHLPTNRNSRLIKRTHV